MRDIKEIEKRYKDRNRIPKRTSNLFKKKYFIVIILIVAFITNPSENKHKEAVRDKVNGIVMPVDISGYQTENPYIEQLIATRVSSTDYLFFSTTQATWDNQTVTIGFGVFSNVFLSKMINEIIGKQFN